MSYRHRRYYNKSNYNSSYKNDTSSSPIKTEDAKINSDKLSLWIVGIIGSIIFFSIIGWDYFWSFAFFGGMAYFLFISVRDSNKDKKIKENKEREQKIIEKRLELFPYVKFVIPDNLEDIRKKITEMENNIRIKSAHLEAVAPYWTRERFVSHNDIHKKETTSKIYVDDIEDILTPNKPNWSWSQIETEIMSKKCKYPSQPPISRHDEFVEYPFFNKNIKDASFEYDDTKISKAEWEEYFSSEIKQIDGYNKQKLELLPLIDSVNKWIHTYNKEEKIKFDKYVEENSILERKAFDEFTKVAETYEQDCEKYKNTIKKMIDGYKNGEKEEVIRRLNFVLNDIKFPDCIPHTWEVDFNTEERIAIVEIGLPDVIHNPPVKEVQLKSGLVEKPLSQAEKREVVPNIHPAILLRTAYEIFQNDTTNTIKLLVLNGWIKFDDPKTGINTKAYTASLMVEKNQIENINLKKIDPLVAFMNLKGKSAGKLIEIIPVTPVMSLDRKDKRFIATAEVLNKLGSETNLASMDWQDFESLIAELFEKEFAKEGAEVKVTQASRDRGVDAIIFDPDPIRGGKIIVQAKRYANTVDVSAVRDLCAVVKKEGAIKGILVTTSTYGGDAYKFANNEPVTLLNGAELLGLLKKHGYTFRINLEEAKKLNLANNFYAKK